MIQLARLPRLQSFLILPLPGCEAQSYRRVEVTTGSRAADNDGESNSYILSGLLKIFKRIIGESMRTNCICPSDLKNRSKSGLSSIEEERGLGSYPRVHIEKDS